MKFVKLTTLRGEESRTEYVNLDLVTTIERVEDDDPTHPTVLEFSNEYVLHAKETPEEILALAGVAT